MTSQTFVVTFSFCSLMHYQAKEIPEDFFVDIISQQNFLTMTLSQFFYNLDNSSAKNEIKKRGEKFKQNLQRRFKWDFSSEPDEYAPVVVSQE